MGEFFEGLQFGAGEEMQVGGQGHEHDDHQHLPGIGEDLRDLERLGSIADDLGVRIGRLRAQLQEGESSTAAIPPSPPPTS